MINAKTKMHAASIRSLASSAVTLLLVCSAPVSAQICSLQSSDASYGLVDSLSATNNDAIFRPFTVRCSGLAGRTIRLCIEMTGDPLAGSPPRRILQGASTTLAHEIYSDSGRTSIWGSWGLTSPAYGTGGLQVDLVLPSAGTPSASMTPAAFARIQAPQPAAVVGDYVSRIANSGLTYAYVDGRSCPLAGAARATDATGFLITAKINPNCTLGVTPLSFGTVGALAGGVTAMSRIELSCTLGTAYAIALDAGLNAAGPNQRRLANGGDSILYGLYRDAQALLPWGWTDGVDKVGGTGSGRVQVHPVTGRIPAQSLPPPGTYTDRVIVSVTY